MKLDTHVHTRFSGNSTIKPLDRLLRESYNTPDEVYRLAKRRGMDLVTITDHDQIAGALTLAHLPDVIVGCEVTATFPADAVQVHLGVLDITEQQFEDIRRLQRDITQLLPYLKQHRIFVSLNHVASRVNRRITASHIAALLPWIDAFEVLNGSRLRVQNATASALARTHGKIGIAGSDAHTYRGIGRAWVEAPYASTRAQFLRDLHAGRVRVGGSHGHLMTMASDVIRATASLHEEHGRLLLEKPWRWRRQLMAACLVAGIPVVTVPLVASALHFVLEARFNRSLLEDINRRPDLRLPEVA